MTAEYLYRGDRDAINEWMLAQWRTWLEQPGAEGFELCRAAVLAPLGPEGDEARAAYTAGVNIKGAAIWAGVQAKIAAMVVRPGAPGELAP